MTNQRVRIGIVGAGDIARKVNLPKLLAIPGVEVVAVCNATTESAREVASRFAIPEVVEHWTAMVGRDDVDAIWIGTPPSMHAPISISALEEGKHVFCQARMAMNLVEARAMLAAAQKRPDLVTMLSEPPMGMKADKLFQKLVAEDYTGELYHFRLQAVSGMFGDPTAPTHWRQRRELVGVNVLSVGIFAEILQRWLGAPSRLQAMSRVCVPTRDGYDVTVPDVVEVIGEWDGGVLGSLEWTGVSLFAPESTLTLYGREGTLQYNFSTDEVRGARRGDECLTTIALPAELQRTWSMENDFIDAIRTGARPAPSFDAGVAYMEFTEAVQLSAATQREVKLPLSN